METSNTDNLGKGSLDTQHTSPSQGSSDIQRVADASSSSTQLYFDTSVAQHSEQFQRSPEGPIPANPEGTTAKPDVPTSGSKSPSPVHSTAPTTGTTTTPTSLGNASSPLDAKGPGPEFPRESLTTQSQMHSHHHSHSPYPGSYQQGVASGWPEMGSPQETALYPPQGTDFGGPMHPMQPHAVQHDRTRYNPVHYSAAIKLLVSNNVAGSIIGRSGQTISELQKQSSSRIKLSQSGDYYPGTQDRVCLVQGDPANCKVALQLLLERLHMLQEHQHSQHMAWQLQRQKGSAPSFDFMVRLLVPVSSCGMIIGKSGSNIKLMEETTGVSSVRLSPKDSGDGGFSLPSMIAPTSERIVTVTGPNMEACLKCVHAILEGMVAHPDISRYTNMTTSYSSIASDSYQGAPHPPRPVLMPAPPTGSRGTPQETPLWDIIPPPGPFSLPSDGLSRRIASSPDLPGFMQDPTGPTADMHTPDRLGGYLHAAGPPQSPYSLPVPGTGDNLQQLYLMPQVQTRHFDHHPNEVHHVGHSVSAPDLLAVQLEQSMHLSDPVPNPPTPPSLSPGPHFADTFAPQPPTMTAPGCFSAQVLVPDSMIGSILGRGGTTLTELETLSGTRIRASQRGEFVPGTRSRIVTIRGQSAQSVWQAQFMMNHRMVLPPTANFSSTQQQHHVVTQSEHSTSSTEDKNATAAGATGKPSQP